ncbi:MAG: serine/threonine-protein kinase [Planctomycetaceae bacterium]
MTVQLTSKSFRDVLALSRLLSVEDIERLCDEHPDETAQADSFAKLLVRERLVTQWQADKLLQAKHRGFFLGNYKLCSLLARGGMSTIYVAEEVETQQICALKILPPSRAKEASYLPRFLREADLASRLEHPNIVRVYGLHTVSDGKSDVYFMAMELLHGADLSEEVNARGPLSIRTAAEVVRQSALGLEYAHQAGLVHRDVKPGNLFRTLEGDIRILDLGLASMLEGEQENLTRQYNERVLGTADYLAPEQAVDSHRADSRADIYALGATLYFMLTGQPPFNEGSLPQRILAHQTKQPRPVTELRPDVPAEIAGLLNEMMVKKRSQRIQTAAEVSKRFQDWLAANEFVSKYSDRPIPPVSAAESSAPERLADDGPFVTHATQQKTPTDRPGVSDTRPFREQPAAEAPLAEAARSAEEHHSAEEGHSPATGHPGVATAFSPDPALPGEVASVESESSPYATAFEEFLQRLDEQSGAATVMSVSALAQRHRRLSEELESSFSPDDENPPDDASEMEDSDSDVAIVGQHDAAGVARSDDPAGRRWPVLVAIGIAVVVVLTLAAQVKPLREFFSQLLNLPG